METLRSPIASTEVLAAAERISDALGAGFVGAEAEHQETWEPTSSRRFPNGGVTTRIWTAGDAWIEHELREGDNGADHSHAFEYFVEQRAVLQIGGVRVVLEGTHALTRVEVTGTDAERVRLARGAVDSVPA